MSQSGKGPRVDVPEELLSEIDSPDAAEQASGSDAESAESSELAAGLDDPESSEAESSEAASAEAASEGATADVEELKSRYLRLAADFDNFKKRALKERQDLHNYATENLIKELLATVDNLERAVGHGRQEEGDAKSLLEGVELTYRSLMQALEKLGVQAVEGVGQPFNPEVQEAIRQVPSDEHGSGVVVEVLQKGYLLKDRLMRAALVAVSSGPGNKSA